MVADLESRAKSFEEEIIESIRTANGPDCVLINDIFYSAGIEVAPLEKRSEVLSYLSQHQDAYGELHPVELSPSIDQSKISSILMSLTEEQALNLAKAVDRAYSRERGYEPLRQIKGIHVSSLCRSSITQSHLC